MNILIADDEKIIRLSLTELFEYEGYSVFTACNGKEVFELLNSERIHAAIIDYQMPGMNGLEILNIIKKEYPAIEVIMITAFGNENIAISAIKNGAFDYIAKPFNNEELVNRIRHIEKIVFKNDEQKLDEYLFLSDSMKNIIDTVKSIAHADVPVLITGESGTGKEIIARLVHYYSGRKGKFVAVNCSAIPPLLIESELFGAVKGSYTGAYSDRAGLFKEADEGTLFLDEIGDMMFDLQSKLLRVLQEGTILPVGAREQVKINVRIIAATNKNIEDEIKKEKFREDLYYRINVIRLKMPSLIERSEEIIPLANIFLKKFCLKYKKNIIGFTDEVINIIKNYAWPGNIRQLKSSIEKWTLLCNEQEINCTVCDIKPANIECNDVELNNKKGVVKAFDFNTLPKDLSDARKIVTEDFEKQFIIHHLKNNNWNITKTSEATGIFRQHLHTKIKKYNIKKDTSDS